MALHVLPLTLVALRLVREADVLQQGAVADGSLVSRRGALTRPFAAGRAVVASGHEHARLLGAADGGRAFADVWEMRQPGDVVQQAGCLGVVRVAVGVAVLLLDVPTELPALPLLQDLGLHLKDGRRRKPNVVNVITGGKVSLFVKMLLSQKNKKTHFLVDEAVQDGHQESLWRQATLSQSPIMNS